MTRTTPVSKMSINSNTLCDQEPPTLQVNYLKKRIFKKVLIMTIQD